MTIHKKPVSVFLSYAHEDETCLKELVKHLTQLQREGSISTWHDRKILPGTDKAKTIKSYLESASLILLLVSSDFLASDACYDDVMLRALERDAAGEARVIPIIVRPCDWSHTPFANLELLPYDGKAITTSRNRDLAWNDVTAGIRKTIEDLQQVNTPAAQPPPQETRPEKKPVPSHIPSIMDVCIVCALSEEVKAVFAVVEQFYNVSWNDEVNKRYGYTYRLATILNGKGEPLNIHISWLPTYGSPEMILHLSRVIEEYQPRLAAMTGICAGDKRHVHLGDLVVAERTFTYDNGKVVKDEHGQNVYQRDTTTYQIDKNIQIFLGIFDQWRPRVASLPRPVSKRQQRDWLLERLLSEPTAAFLAIPQAELQEDAPDWRDLLHELQHGSEPFLLPSRVLRDRTQVEDLQYGLTPFPFQDPAEARCHIRPMASGSAVRSDNPFQEIQIPVRGAIAIDMEGAAFGRVIESFPATRWLVVKGVSDYADKDKDDSYHTYAATASAMYMLSFIEAYVTQERLPSPAGNDNSSRDGPPSSSPFVEPFPEVWNVFRRPNPFFTGRSHVLEQLHTGFKRRNAVGTIPPQAITGLGGMGKTQTAAEYAYHFRADYQAVLWVRAETQEDLITDFKAVAKLLKRPEADLQDRASLIGTMQEWFRRETNWLLILDNADDLALVNPFLPAAARGHIILTTRTGAVAGVAQSQQLSALEVDDAALCILLRAGLLPWDTQLADAPAASVDVARELAQLLGGLPLALEQAGAYINDTECGVRRYLNLYKQQYRPEMQIIHHGEVPDYPEAVAYAWKVSKQAVEETRPAAADLLRLCACLAPEAIPDELIEMGAPVLGPVLGPVVANPVAFDQAIALLLKYSLLNRESDHDVDSTRLSIHRVWQEILLDEMDEPTQKLWAERAVRTVDRAFPPISWPHIQAHAHNALRLIEQWHMTFPEAKSLQRKVQEAREKENL